MTTTTNPSVPAEALRGVISRLEMMRDSAGWLASSFKADAHAAYRNKDTTGANTCWGLVDTFDGKRAALQEAIDMLTELLAREGE